MSEFSVPGFSGATPRSSTCVRPRPSAPPGTATSSSAPCGSARSAGSRRSARRGAHIKNADNDIVGSGLTYLSESICGLPSLTTVSGEVWKRGALLFECSFVPKPVTDIKRVPRPFMKSRYLALVYTHTQVDCHLRTYLRFPIRVKPRNRTPPDADSFVKFPVSGSYVASGANYSGDSKTDELIRVSTIVLFPLDAFCPKLRNNQSLVRIFRTFGTCLRTLYALVWSAHDESVHVHDCLASFANPIWFGNNKFCCNPRARQSAAVDLGAKTKCVRLRGYNWGMIGVCGEICDGITM